MSNQSPKPTYLRILEGNPSRRPLNENEPKPSLDMPRCPKHLNKEARKAWKRLSQQLYDMGALTEIDGEALAMYCDAWATWVHAKEQLEKIGEVVKSPKSGFPVLNPFFSIASTSWEQMRRILCEFGMTPSSRSRVQIDPKRKKKDEMEELID